MSFPHVEGPDVGRAAGDRPAGSRADFRARPDATGRGAAAVRADAQSATTPVVLRLGMIYGRGILMVEAARWLARRRLLLCLEGADVVPAAVDGRFPARDRGGDRQAGVAGIYHVGDEQPVTLQQFLDDRVPRMGLPAAPAIPFPLIYAAAWLCEAGGHGRAHAVAAHA